LTLAWRELRLYFSSWMAYAVAAGFLAISGLIFWIILSDTQEAQLRWTIENIVVIFLFITPLITMRLLAEEKRSGTLELLMTSPVTDAQVVLGKFLGALGLLVVLLVPTLVFPGVLARYGDPDWGPILSGYLGLFLAGACFVAVGVLASPVTESQVVAGFLAFGTLLGLWIVGWAAGAGSAGAKEAIAYVSVLRHFADFPKGLIQTKDVVYYLTFVAFCLFAAMRSLESRKWR